MKRTLLLNILLTCLLIGLAGCSGKPLPPAMKVYWPPPPAEPKLEWITTFSSEDNFPKTEGQVMAEKFLGRKTLNFLKKPMGVAADSQGVIYVADLDANNILVIDFSMKTMSPYLKDAIIGLPVGLAFDSQDNLYVAETYYKQVLVYNKAREMVRQIGLGVLEKPTFLAVDEERGRLYVSDVLKHEVVVFGLANGEKLFSFGGAGSEPGKLFGPQGIAIDREGRVFVAEQFNARVQVFDGEGKHLYMFGSRGDAEFQFEGPRGLTFDRYGDLYVAEARKAALMVFSPDGSPLTMIGGGGRTTHQLGFSMPTSVFIDGGQRLYISDGMNRRIAIWQYLTPEYLAAHPLDAEAMMEIEQRVRKIQSEKDKQ